MKRIESSKDQIIDKTLASAVDVNKTQSDKTKTVVGVCIAIFFDELMNFMKKR